MQDYKKRDKNNNEHLYVVQVIILQLHSCALNKEERLSEHEVPLVAEAPGAKHFDLPREEI